MKFDFRLTLNESEYQVQVPDVRVFFDKNNSFCFIYIRYHFQLIIENDYRNRFQ